MARIGVIDLHTGSGWVEVDVADPADVEKPAVEVYVGDQWGAIPLVDPADADTGIEVYDGSQWWGVSQEALKLIDSFEDGDHSEYTDTSGDYFVVEDTSLAKDGDYLVDFQGGEHSGAGLVSTSDLPRYPSPGDVFEGHSQLVYSEDFAGVQFACQTESDTFPDGYRCQVDGGQDRIEILKHTGGGGTFSLLGSSSLTVSNHLNEWLRHEVKWATNGDITYTVYNSSDTQLAQATGNDTTYSSGGFGWASETNSNLASEQHVYHDYAYISGSV